MVIFSSVIPVVVYYMQGKKKLKQQCPLNSCPNGSWPPEKENVFSMPLNFRCVAMQGLLPNLSNFLLNFSCSGNFFEFIFVTLSLPILSFLSSLSLNHFIMSCWNQKFTGVLCHLVRWTQVINSPFSCLFSYCLNVLCLNGS